MNVTGAIQSKTVKEGKTNGRAWTRTTIMVEGKQYSTLRGVSQNTGAYVSVEFEVNRFGYNITHITDADPAPLELPSKEAPPHLSAYAPERTESAATNSGIREILTHIENIEIYLSQFDKKYLEILQNVAENVAQQSATIQTISGTTTRLSTDFADFMKDEAED